MEDVLVTGATGLHGGAVVDALLAAGHRVRAFTRDGRGERSRRLAGRGAEIAVGDLLDTGSLVAAMRGAAAVYAVTTPVATAMYRYLEHTGYQVDIAALRAQFPEVPWTSFARWVGERLGDAGRQP